MTLFSLTARGGATLRARLAPLFLTSALIAPGTVLAQAAPSRVTLDTVVLQGQSDEDDQQQIVARRNSAGNKMQTDILDTSATVSVVTQKEIERRNPQNLEQVLSYTAGVVGNEWGGDDRYDFVMIRGFATLNNGTYRDGLSERGFGWTFGRMEPYAMERVEVLKGANSALFGLSGPGGLVNAVTKTPRNARFGEVYTTLGEDHTEFGTDFGDTNRDGSLSYRVTAKWQDSAYDYDYSQDDRRYLGFSLTWRPDEVSSLTLLADFNERKGVPGTGYPSGVDLDLSTFLGEPEFNAFDTTQRSFGWQYSRDLGEGLTFRQNARYSYMNLNYEQVYGASTDATANRSSFYVGSTNRQFIVDTQLQYDRSFGNWDSRTLVGIEYGKIKVDEVAKYGTAGPIDIYDPSYCGLSCISLADYIDWEPEETRKSIYLQEELTINDRWIATIGGRYDHAEIEIGYPASGTRAARTFEDFTGRLGLTYKATSELSFYGNYSESFEPNVWDITADSQKGRQYELGAKYRPAGMDALFTAAIFDLRQTNVNVQVDQNITRQVGEIGVRGLELEAKASPTDRIDVIASYSHWDAEVLEDGIEGNEGNRPADVPRNTASLWLDYTIPALAGRGDLKLGAGVRYVGATYSDVENTTRVGGRTVVDAAASYDLAKNVDLALNVSNLFDKEYKTVSYYGTDYYGEGRKVTATVKYKW
jgi:iron complex outermembrane receptor protein